MAATQKHRAIAVNSPLGADALLFRRMTADECLSRPFEYRLDLFSEDMDIVFNDVLGQPLVVRLDLPKEEGIRYFHGLVSQFRQVRGQGRYAVYQATLRPWLWFLSRTRDCRIYQQMAVPEIVTSIFREHGFGDFQTRLSEQYPPRDYCVQYRESTFDFVSRLLEEEGIYYHFEHAADKHILILADSAAAHESFPGYSELRFLPPGIEAGRQVERIYNWELTQQVQPGAYAHTDFDFTAPRKDLYRRLEVPRHHALDRYEVFDYPGAYTESEQGHTYARVRLEELRAQHQVVEGQADARGLAAGRLFSLTHFPRQDQNRRYLLTATTIGLDADDYESRPEGQPSGLLCDCRFTAMDPRESYRPPRVTPKALVQGPQTATVVGPEGQEIWTDQHGRVKCQFHWDRYGESNEISSCWIRVSQPWAGKNWGGISVPRIGQEVIVDFLEGDPDRPIITGRLYNGVNLPPYPLPAGAVVSGMKSATTGKIAYRESQVPLPLPAGKAAASHAAAGRETWGDAKALASDLASASGDTWHSAPQGFASHALEPDAAQAIAQKTKDALRLHPPAEAPGGGSGYNEICMDDTRGQELMRIHAQFNKDATVNNNETSQVGNDVTRTVGNNETVNITTDETVTVGNNSTETIGTNKVITAGTSITLKCGAASIHMNQAGVITITGSLITVGGTVNINVAAPITTVTGAAVMMTTGAINLVNGGITRIVGTSLGHFEGGKAELVSSSETLVMGPVVKINE
ncbi:type VI secretion system Vgr family protein [uncultured Thiodictyon sp.]|jgi:type VI secretion system secreted protein VgrG|uniref:type VI secretion system Vgr family protein n=1 Tax=uncultured Thiodictyon sp. TaxID=1846217 RepID=UPI0025F597A3|nr:type VI secretion system tip protein VgrG [uncultured Thiodictyon sp.]